jgi:hypothetical protein
LNFKTKVMCRRHAIKLPLSTLKEVRHRSTPCSLRCDARDSQEAAHTAATRAIQTLWQDEKTTCTCKQHGAEQWKQ